MYGTTYTLRGQIACFAPHSGRAKRTKMLTARLSSTGYIRSADCGLPWIKIPRVPIKVLVIIIINLEHLLLNVTHKQIKTMFS